MAAVIGTIMGTIGREFYPLPMDDLDECMAVPKKLRLPKDIAPEGVAMMEQQLNRHTVNREQAVILVKLVAMQHPKKPYWWQVAKALWEQERGIC